VKNKIRPPYAIESVDNALRLAQLLLEGPVRVTDAAARLGVSRSTAHRLLAMLVYRDFAEQGPDRSYRAGVSLTGSGGSSATQVALLLQAARPHLARLVAHTNESANLVVLTGSDVRFVTTIEGEQALRAADRTGKLRPAHLTSGGLAMLGCLGRDDVDERIGHLEADERHRAQRDIAAARRNGYAINNQLTERGVTAVGVPIFDSGGQAVAAISLAMPSLRFSPRQLPFFVDEIQACSAAIGLTLSAPLPNRPRRKHADDGAGT
jgi:DNA-binding IclR family transcriptional regulator